VSFLVDEKVQGLLFHDLSIGFVQTIAVGRLKNQHVAWRWWFRIAKDRHIRTAKISAEEHGGGIAARCIFHTDSRRSQNMVGIVKGCRDARGYLEHVSVSCPLESSNELTDIIVIVEWPNTGPSLPLFLLINVATIIHLHASRIFEHEFRQIISGSGEIHFSGKPVLLKYRQGARMVNMGVG
jgi:hypothetical protein